jgi:hypothetical protein
MKPIDIFVTTAIFLFCLHAQGGCRDPLAVNYNAKDTDVTTCIYKEVIFYMQSNLLDSDEDSMYLQCDQYKISKIEVYIDGVVCQQSGSVVNISVPIVGSNPPQGKIPNGTINYSVKDNTIHDCYAKIYLKPGNAEETFFIKPLPLFERSKIGPKHHIQIH